MISVVLVYMMVYACSACIIEQPSITLGDRYTLYDNNDILICKVVATPPCRTHPSLILQSQMGEKTVIIPFDQREYEYEKYKKIAYFYRIEEMELDRVYEWSVKADNTLGPYRIRISDKSDFHEHSYLLVSNMDISDNSLYIQKSLSEMDWDKYDMLIHNGNFAFDLQDKDGSNGDLFFKSMGSIVSQVPYMVVGGYRDNIDNSRMMNYRYKMPSSDIHMMSNNIYHIKQGSAIMIFINGMQYIHSDTRELYHKVLSDIFARCANSPKILWKIVFISTNYYCTSEELECNSNVYEMKALMDYLEKNRVHVVFDSQRDVYKRYKPIDMSFNIRRTEMKTRYGMETVDNNTIFISYGSSGNKYSAKNGDIEGGGVQSSMISYTNASFNTYMKISIKPYYMKIDTIDTTSGLALDSYEISISSSYNIHPYKTMYFILMIISSSLLVLIILIYNIVYHSHPKDDQHITRVTSRYWDDIDLTVVDVYNK